MDMRMVKKWSLTFGTQKEITLRDENIHAI